MTDLIHVPFAGVLASAVIWVSAFSMSSTPGIRGYRNLGILACYLSLIVFLFIAGWRRGLATWACFGVLGGAAYILWEIVQRLRTPDGEEKPPVRLSHLVWGQFGWPIMIPETLEYFLAEFGVLPSPQPIENEPKTDAEQIDGEGRS